jgi:hypothetical protein
MNVEALAGPGCGVAQGSRDTRRLPRVGERNGRPGAVTVACSQKATAFGLSPRRSDSGCFYAWNAALAAAAVSLSPPGECASAAVGSA